MKTRFFGLIAIATLVTASGCLYDMNGRTTCLSEYRGAAVTSTPTFPPTILAWVFSEGGGMHGLGSVWWLCPTPVSPALSYEIEEWKERKDLDGVAILGPIRGEFAPIFCMDPPTEKEIYETLKPVPHGVPFLYEMHRKNVRFSTEKLADKVDPTKLFPLAGPCQLHHCHFKCTIWWDETVTTSWPIPTTYTEHKQEVVYIDKDHLHRAGEPGHVAPAAGTSRY